jgi:hypothetical protein
VHARTSMKAVRFAPPLQMSSPSTGSCTFQNA